MYSAEIERMLKTKNIKIGDRIEIVKDKETYEGILMPRIELGDLSSLVIKLDNGYNIGIKLGKNANLKLLKKGKKVVSKQDDTKIEHSPNLPNVSILGCGGTIASRIEYTTGAVFPAFSPADLLNAFPELKNVANIRGRKLFNLLSEDIAPEHWQLMARETAKEVKSGVDGVVLMHGTDTMHYSSAALSFMLQDLPVPVVLVGAQRSSDRGSSDNLTNLVFAVVAAGKSDVAQVSICMHGSESDNFCYLHQGTKVRKMHTSRRDAFRSINVNPIAKISYPDKNIEYLRKDYLKRGKRKIKVDDKINSNVALIYIHPLIKPRLIDKLSDYDGVVLAGTGLGHMPTNPFNDKFGKNLVPSIENLISSGIPVAIASQALYGRLNLNIYTTGRKLNEVGVIGDGCDWLPEVCLIKLMWVLGHTKNIDKVKEAMLRNYAGEITERTEVIPIE